MTLDLSDDEASDLTDLLDSAISDLSPEIADTDNPAYRKMLREKRERLRAIRGKLASSLPTS
jgi:hypothetical protein